MPTVASASMDSMVRLSLVSANLLKMLNNNKECFVHGRQKTSFPEDPFIKFEVSKSKYQLPLSSTRTLKPF